MVVIVQLEVVEQVMGYSEYDLTRNKLVDTVNLKYPPSLFNTVGLVSFYIVVLLQLEVMGSL